MLRIEGISKSFGSVLAVDDVTLSIREGEFFALLGPSGCGKTTLLRILAGFERPESGQLLLDGTDIVGMKPYRRPVNMMFQSYALFPHMSVFDNVAYGLRQEKLSKSEVARQTEEALEMVGLLDLARRRPGMLSGGQQQRVALARAVVKRPRALLLDEPLAALDRKLRVEMRLELKRLQHEVGIAFVFVTHDQEEALTMGDRAAVMNHGRVLQVGTPEELYELPDSLFVANFIGESNTFVGKLSVGGDEVTLVGQHGVWRVAPQAHQRAGLSDGEVAAMVIRPERLRVEPATSAAPVLDQELNETDGIITDLAYLGSTRKSVIELRQGMTVIAQSQAGQRIHDLAEGDEVRVSWEIRHGILVADETMETKSTI